LRLALLSTLGLGLAWITLTKSLPFALAPAGLDWALALSPNNPPALIAKASKIRERLLAQSSVTLDPAETKESGAFSQRANILAGLPEAESKGNPYAFGGEREAMRKEIHELASRALASDPLNAHAYELLGETVDDPERVRILMQEAVNRSRRVSGALFWLLNDSFHRKDYQKVLDYSDLLLRTRPQLAGYVLSYLALVAEDVEGLPVVVFALAKKPSWRGQFFKAFAKSMRQTEIPLKLMIALKESGAPPTAMELAPYLDALIGKNRVDAAYNAWLQFVPPAELDKLGLLTNANFERSPSGLPFDWRIAPGLNAFAGLVGPINNGAEGALRVSFGSGRIKFPELSQIVFLGPGRYRLEGKLRGLFISKRGLRWQLACITGAHQVLAETAMLMGETQQWRIFKLEAEVPAGGDCTGQLLRLFHDSRSASEEFISGELWFGGLRLERVPNTNGVSEAQ
jgi:hypothetical protein